MSDVYIMTTIIDRKNSKKYIDLYKKDKLEVMYITLGRYSGLSGIGSFGKDGDLQFRAAA